MTFNDDDKEALGEDLDEKTALAILKKHGLKPLGEYVNSYTPNLCR